jgi:hypothetical protein
MIPVCDFYLKQDRPIGGNDERKIETDDNKTGGKSVGVGTESL